jgi:hypothetical protein
LQVQVLEEEIARKDMQLAHKEAEEQRRAEAEMQDANHLLVLDSLQQVRSVPFRSLHRGGR